MILVISISLLVYYIFGFSLFFTLRLYRDKYLYVNDITEIIGESFIWPIVLILKAFMFIDNTIYEKKYDIVIDLRKKKEGKK